MRDSQKEIFDGFLNHANVGSVVICVHGFNVHFHDAQTWFGILTDSLRHTDELANKVVTDPVEQDRKQLVSKKTGAGSLTAFIGFSWPSNGDVFSYQSDQSEATGSANVLANLIARIRSLTSKPSVNLICHSMGNFLACRMCSQLISGVAQPQPATSKAAKELELRIGRWESGKKIVPEDLYFVDRYIMLAADVERRHLTKCVEDVKQLGKENEKATYVGPFYSGLEHLVGQVHNFYSRFDGALAISSVEKTAREAALSTKGVLDKFTFGVFDFLKRNPHEKWEQRIGATRHPINSPPNMTSHNAVELARREIGHSDYIDSHEIAVEIAKILVSPIT